MAKLHVSAAVARRAAERGSTSQRSSMSSKKRSYSAQSAAAVSSPETTSTAQFEDAEDDGELTPARKRNCQDEPPELRDTSVRPSRFLEGSMNDRVSNAPPSHYVGEDGTVGGGVKNNPSRNSYQSTSQGSTNRNSGIFRFGKSLAAAFNPVNLWPWRHSSEVSPTQTDDLKARQERAERVYAEMKARGQFGPKGILTEAHPGTLVPSVLYDDTSDGPPPSLSRDSGVDVDSYRSSDERKRDGRVFLDDDFLMPPPPAPRSRSRSPMSETDSVRTTRTKKLVRKQPSKKDLQKQQKLTKKVSDLEVKLDLARRELRQALGDAPPVPQVSAENLQRTPFVPGVLSSLPSERLLVHQPDGSLTAGSTEAAKDRMPRKRKSSGDETDFKDEHNDNEAARGREDTTPMKPRGRARGRKSQKVNEDDGPSSVQRAEAVADSDHESDVDVEGVTEPRVPDSANSLDKIATDVTSIFHNGQPKSPVFLGKPRLIPPMKSSKIPRRSISPPPSLSYSKPSSRNAQAAEGSVSVRPDSGSVPPMPKMPKGMERIVRLASGEMDPASDEAKPKSQAKQKPQAKSTKKTSTSAKTKSKGKQEFEWPEDVF